MLLTRRTVTSGLALTVLTFGPRSSRAKPVGEPLVIEAAEAKLRLTKTPAAETAVWAYNGRVPGPLIRVRKGEEVAVRLVNKLAQPTSLCWHGVRVPNAMDGVAGLTQAPVMPGESFDYRFAPPDAGIYWYHPYDFPHNAEQIGRALYGLLVVDEPDPPPVDHDMLVVVANWRLDAKGQIDAAFDAPWAGNPGDFSGLVTVNTQAVPTTPATVRPGARVRLRLLNASPAQIAIVTLRGAAPTIIAIDGQPSELFPPAGGSLPIGPGSRFEIMADMPMDAGKTVSLVLPKGPPGPDRASELVLMTLATHGTPLPARSPLKRLPENGLLPSRIPLERAIKPILTIGDATSPSASPRERKGHDVPPKPAPAAMSAVGPWTINGARFEGFPGKPLFRVKRGGAVSISFVNKTAVVQQMHVHGHVLRVLHDLDDGWDPYWRESILIGPGKTKHVAFVADNPGRWMIESLILDRQVNGLAGWFEVG